MECVDHSKGVQRLAAPRRALHDCDVARVLLRAALAQREVDREAKTPDRDEGEEQVAIEEIGRLGSAFETRWERDVVYDDETLEVHHQETNAPEDVNRGVSLDDPTDREGEQGPQPRRRESEGKILKERPVHHHVLTARPFPTLALEGNHVRLMVVRRRGLGSLARASAQDLFDQSTAFGRLALVHVAMMAGDTLVTVSLAGSLFFSVSPTEAKGKVLAYLLLTIAPFAVVSPILGPLIDRSANGRRILIALSAGLRAILCWMMNQHLHSLWLFPMAFLVLISSKLYVVTRGALVPEMARTDQLRAHASAVGHAGWPSEGIEQQRGFAGFNAQLTFLGTLAGLLAGALGAGVLKGLGAPSVLVIASFVFLGATVASLRLQRPPQVVRDEVTGLTQAQRDRNALNPMGDVEVVWGLSAAALMRFSVGFATFLLAFGLRRENAGLGWFAVALAISALGALIGLALVTRVRNAVAESTLLTFALLGTGIGAGAAATYPTLYSQVVLAGWLGLCSAVAQPTFDSITQQHVAPGAQGRTFARFAVRQQLLWVVGAVIPVAIALRFSIGDGLLSVLMITAGLVYGVGRCVAHH